MPVFRRFSVSFATFFLILNKMDKSTWDLKRSDERWSAYFFIIEKKYLEMKCVKLSPNS